MHVEADTSTHHIPSSRSSSRRGTDGRNDNNGFALAAHPDESQGRPPTNTGSQPIVLIGLPDLRFPRSPPVPDGRTILRRPLTPPWGCRPTVGPARRPHLSYRIPTPSSRSTPGSAGRS